MNAALELEPAPAPAPTPHPPGLAAALRDGTRQAHHDAERGHFVRDLIRGDLPRASYLDYLRSLRTIYAALESALHAHADHPIVGRFLRPELLRSPALARDLHHLGATDLPASAATDLPASAATDLPASAATDLPASAASITYASRLHHLADHAPRLLIAHVYTRYLGDLSGGQLLRRGAARLLGLTAPAPGLEFYDFPAIPDLDAYKREFRSALDACPLTPDQRDAIVDEARRAFADSAALFSALA